MQRRHYSTEFKQQMVNELLESQLPVSVFAKKHLIEHSILHRWLQKNRESTIEVSKLPSQQKNEIQQIRKELAAVKQSVNALRNVIRKSLSDRYRTHETL